MPDFSFNTPFDLQVEFLRRKLDLPTATWTDIWQSAHDRAFVVAGAMKADLLADLHAALLKPGVTLAGFRQDFNRAVAAAGWTGWAGEGSKGGRAWRIKVIYQTNMATSYAAGRWQQINDPDLADFRPYITYHHADGVAHPRPLHLAWNGLTLPKGHPFWKTHAAPNGWGCHCYLSAAGPKEYAAAQAKGKTEPPPGWDVPDEKTGAPPGIDRGWGYAPGANAATPLREMVEQKLFALDAPLGAAMWAGLKPVIALEQRLAMMDLVDAAAASMQPANRAALAYVAAPATVADLAARQVMMPTADIWLRDTELIHALRDIKSARGAALTVQTWRDLPALLEQAEPYWDTVNSTLVYVFEAPDGPGKVAIRAAFTAKVQDGAKGRSKLTSNFIRTGGRVESFNITEGGQYVPLNK